MEETLLRAVAHSHDKWGEFVLARDRQSRGSMTEHELLGYRIAAQEAKVDYLQLLVAWSRSLQGV